MGITYASIHFLSDEAVTLAPYLFASWSENWQSMIPTEDNRELLTDPEASYYKARKLSKASGKTVLWFFLFDEERVSFSLFSNGKTAASYNAFSSDKNLSKIPALIGLEESYRKRLSKIISCTDPDYQTQLLEEFFGVKLLLFPEMLDEDAESARYSKSDKLFKQYEAETRVPSGKSSPIQVKLLFELEGVLSSADWNEKYHECSGYLWTFQKHYWLYAESKYTGMTEKPACFRNGQLVFISDEEMLQFGTDQHYNETRNLDPLFEDLFHPTQVRFSEAAPAPYSGNTVKLPRGFYGLGFDGARFLISNERSSIIWMDHNGKLLAKLSVKGDIIDHDGSYLLTWEEKWDTFKANGMTLPKRYYGIIRGYQIIDK
ncbi:MAG: hypothetical protein IJC19_06090 [Clostridia bacterium]|nr:hypothetical protein [Clostridia bacterium]